MVVRADDARRLNLRTISDAARIASQLRLGVGYEFESRPDGLPGLSAAYNLHFAGRPAPWTSACSTARSPTIKSISSPATPPTAPSAPSASSSSPTTATSSHPTKPSRWSAKTRSRAHPEIQTAMDQLAGKLSAEDMQAMNDAVDGKHQDVAEVVRAFRARKGL